MRHSPFQIAVVSALCLTAVNAWPQQTLTVPSEFLHVSNPGLTPEREGSVNVLRVLPSYSFVNVDGASRAEVSLGAVLERSSNTALRANRSDPRLGLNWQWSTPTSLLALSGSLREASTRTAEFESTGRVTVDSTQRTGAVGAEWSRDLSPVTRMVLDAAHSTIAYRTPLLVGYRENSTSATIERSLAEDIRLSVTARYGRLQPEDRVLYAKGTRTSLLLDYEAALSELWSAGLGIGTARTSGEFRRNTAVGRILLGYRGERVHSSLNWRREVAPNGTVAGYGRTDRFRWTSGIALTSDSALDVSFDRIRPLDEAASARMASAVLRSTLTQFWTASVGYEHRQSLPAEGPRARGSTVSIGLTYSHPDF